MSQWFKQCLIYKYVFFKDMVILLALFEENYPAIQPIFEDIREKHITLTIDFH